MASYLICFTLFQNCNSEVVVGNNVAESCDHSSDEDEPPPLPPPREDSLRRTNYVDRPLPTIPISASLSDFNYDDSDSIDEVKILLIAKSNYNL